MVRRAALVSALVLAAVPQAAHAGTALVRSERVDEVTLSGVGCGSAASSAIQLPASASAIDVKHPKAGETTDESRLTAVAIAGTAVRLTAIGDGPLICDPEEDPDVSPSERPWHGPYVYDIAFRERVQVAYWAGAAVPKTKPALRPRTVRVPDIATMVGVRWQTFGGRTAVGHGRLRCEIPGCVGRGDRFKIVLSKPGHCGDIGDRAFYRRIRFYTTRAYTHLDYPIHRGALYSGGNPQCATTPVSSA